MGNNDRFLQSVYRKGRADTEINVNVWELADELNLDEDTTSDIIDSLLEKGVIVEPMFGTVRITENGIEAVEKRA